LSTGFEKSLYAEDNFCGISSQLFDVFLATKVAGVNKVTKGKHFWNYFLYCYLLLS